MEKDNVRKLYADIKSKYGFNIDWEEEDHPRGQPENAGQFAEKSSAELQAEHDQKFTPKIKPEDAKKVAEGFISKMVAEDCEPVAEREALSRFQQEQGMSDSDFVNYVTENKENPQFQEKISGMFTEEYEKRESVWEKYVKDGYAAWGSSDAFFQAVSDLSCTHDIDAEFIDQMLQGDDKTKSLQKEHKKLVEDREKGKQEIETRKKEEAEKAQKAKEEEAKKAEEEKKKAEEEKAKAQEEAKKKAEDEEAQLEKDLEEYDEPDSESIKQQYFDEAKKLKQMKAEHASKYQDRYSELEITDYQDRQMTNYLSLAVAGVKAQEIERLQGERVDEKGKLVVTKKDEEEARDKLGIPKEVKNLSDVDRYAESHGMDEADKYDLKGRLKSVQSYAKQICTERIDDKYDALEKEIRDGTGKAGKEILAKASETVDKKIKDLWGSQSEFDKALSFLAQNGVIDVTSERKRVDETVRAMLQDKSSVREIKSIISDIQKEKVDSEKAIKEQESTVKGLKSDYKKAKKEEDKAAREEEKAKEKEAKEEGKKSEKSEKKSDDTPNQTGYHSGAEDWHPQTLPQLLLGYIAQKLEKQILAKYNDVNKKRQWLGLSTYDWDNYSKGTGLTALWDKAKGKGKQTGGNSAESESAEKQSNAEHWWDAEQEHGEKPQETFEEPETEPTVEDTPESVPEIEESEQPEVDNDTPAKPKEPDADAGKSKVHKQPDGKKKPSVSERLSKKAAERKQQISDMASGVKEAIRARNGNARALMGDLKEKMLSSFYGEEPEYEDYPDAKPISESISELGENVKQKATAAKQKAGSMFEGAKDGMSGILSEVKSHPSKENMQKLRDAVSSAKQKFSSSIQERKKAAEERRKTPPKAQSVSQVKQPTETPKVSQKANKQPVQPPKKKSPKNTVKSKRKMAKHSRRANRK